MGVPFYFRYLMKNHPTMLHKEVPQQVGVLYLDSNSIVYDCVHRLTADASAYVDVEATTVDFESRLIEAVIDKIRGYIAYCRPKRCFVAFDGVAPLSKMDQQRARRHKSLFSEKRPWNTNAITPGTRFMTALSQALQGLSQSTGVTVSSSEEPGEGEHKLFADLRSKYADVVGDVVVYGLDADLIMLSLLHLRYVTGEGQRLWIFREAPHFEKGPKADKDKEKDEGCLHLDVHMLAACLLHDELKGNDRKKNQQRLIDDYVFLCFFLGNDFLPHFPCLNIRTHGMPALWEMYRSVVTSTTYLVDATTGTICWPLLHKWIAACAKKEPEWFLQEKAARDKMAASMWRQKDMDVLDQAPLLFRGEEHYIAAPTTPGWQQRYYRVLFGFEDKVEAVCEEYKRGLAWVWRYYTHGCDDWRWRYPYTYAPLMADLSLLSHKEPALIPHKGPVHPWTQLAYVLPQQNHHFIPCSRATDLLAAYPHLYVQEVTHFHWSFCRYFWEAHPVLPEIPTGVVEEWDRCFL